MNLENLNVQELNTEEMKNVDGGRGGWLWGGLLYDAVKAVVLHDVEGYGGWLQGGQFRGGAK